VTSAISLGVILGLLLGKPIGLMLLSWLAVRSGLASLPGDVSWRAIFGVGWLAGIGFTMSLFISALAFKSGPALEHAKMGILTGSLIAGVTGYLLLRWALPSAPAAAAPRAAAPSRS
jgi:Na+:H+ antiporter, NhaA family